jgi:hypothetical protein
MLSIVSPAFTFGVLLATFYGAVIHLIFGGDGRRLTAMIAAAWVGFALGQAIGQVMDIEALAIGPINLVAATLGAFIATLTTVFLSAYRDIH